MHDESGNRIAVDVLQSYCVKEGIGDAFRRTYACAAKKYGGKTFPITAVESIFGDCAEAQKFMVYSRTDVAMKMTQQIMSGGYY